MMRARRSSETAGFRTHLHLVKPQRPPKNGWLGGRLRKERLRRPTASVSHRLRAAGQHCATKLDANAPADAHYRAQRALSVQLFGSTLVVGVHRLFNGLDFGRSFAEHPSKADFLIGFYPIGGLQRLAMLTTY